MAPGPSAVTLPAADGLALEADAFEPGSAPAAAVVVFASAMGVRRRFYGPLARWLSARGFAALTFDYRGVGKANRRMRAAMHDWGEQDLEGALRFALQRWPGLPLTLVGHSAGGQLIGLAPSSLKLSAIATVAAQSGYWRHWTGAGRARMAVLWHLLLPVLPRLLGYAPLSKLTGGQDVPAGVAIEWARWGRHPDYIWSYARERPNCYAEIAARLRCYALADDGYAPLEAVRALHALYRNARIEERLVEPRAIGQRAVGHFGFFVEKTGGALWPDLASFLLQR